MIKLNLKYIRDEHDLTQKNLGDIFGVSESTARGWENGHDTMPLYRMIELSNEYGYSIDFILCLSNDNSECKTKINATKEDIGTRLKEIRTTKKYTQQVFAEKCGVSRTTYCNYEEGTYFINTITLYSICVTFKISADWILGRSTTKKLK